MELKNIFVQDIHGDIIPFATATVYEPGTTQKIDGLQDENGDPLPNPFVGTVQGLLCFSAPDGMYDLFVQGAGREFTIRLTFSDAIPPAGSQPVRINASLAGTWILTNPLGRVPMVQVFLPSGEQIIADVTSDLSYITVSFADPQQGYVLAF